MPSDRGETFNPFKPLMISATNFNYILSGWGRSSPLAANFKIFGETTIVHPNLAGAAGRSEERSELSSNSFCVCGLVSL